MNNEELRKLQLVQLRIAKDIKRVCEDNSIQYFLDSGTLLGAVRHGGFIPWDDDLDIGMTRENFEKFKKIAQAQLGDEYFVQTWETDKTFGKPFMKIRLNGTKYIEEGDNGKDIHQGIFVDILPYDHAPDEKSELQRLQKKLITYRRIVMLKCGYYSKFGFTNKIISIMMKPCRKEWVTSKYNTLATSYNSQKCHNSFAHTGTAKLCSWIMPTEVIEKLKPIVFEDTTFLAPENWDEYLSIAYNDYMKLPDEEKRYNGHRATIEFQEHI